MNFKHLIKLIQLIALSLVSSCVGEQTSPISPNLDPSINPVFQGIGLNIKSPTTSSKVLDKLFISGECSNYNYPIQISSPSLSKVVYSICQKDFTWAAAIETSEIEAGAFSVRAQIFNTDYTENSNIESVELIKGEQLCFEHNASELFANYKTGGDGDTSPYVICNQEQFSNIRFFPSKSFVLGKNIDFSNKTIEPIAIPFRGVLDGNGFQISNIVVKDLKGNGISVGLFKFAHGATVRNIAIKNALVEGYQRVGILAGDWRGTGTIENIKVQGKVGGVSFIGGLVGLGNTSSALNITNASVEVEVGGNNYVGGLVSYIVTRNGSFNVNNSYILTRVSGIDYVGGIVGRSLEPNFTIQNTERIGNVSSLGKYVGGVAGQIPGGVISNLKNVGVVSSSVSAEDAFVGGVVGESRDLLTVTDVYSTTNINAGGHYVGGLVGKTHSLSLTSSKFRGNIEVLDTKYDSVTKFVGGVAGGISLSSSIEDARSHVSIDSKSQYVGGLVGIMNGQSSTITGSYYKGELSAYTSHIGGIAGVFGGSMLANTFAQAKVVVTNPTPNSYVGLIAGHSSNNAGVHTRLYSKGDIEVVDGIADYVGGLFGYLNGEALSESYFVGDINGPRSKVGGIVGYTKADISKSYAHANLNAKFRYVGSIAGLVHEANISDVFAKGTVQGKGEVGGLVGWHNSFASNLRRGYFIGTISKLAGSIFEDTTFGNIVGLEGVGGFENAFYANTNQFLDHNLTPFIGNNVGDPLTIPQLRNPVYYTNFNFGEDVWAEPSEDFKLPFLMDDYLYASFDWLREINQGFQIPEVFDHNPLELSHSSIFIHDSDVLSDLDQDHLDVIDTNDPPLTVSPDSLAITVEAPSTNSEVVSNLKLVYGECGIPGNRILIGGDFSISSVCQKNHRWAAVLDVKGLPVGTVNFTVHMKSLDGTQNSNIVNKSMIKSDDLCEQEEAIKGTYANSHLGGDGAGRPFKICHAGHFANIAFNPGASFELMNDIDFGGNTISPIQSVFTGSIEGNGHAIKNYIVKKPSAVGAGLFRLVKDASIRNLNIQGANVRGYERVGLLTGSWVGQGTLSNVNAKGAVEGILYTGGLIGLVNSEVDLHLDQVNTEINVKGNGFTGGVIGYVSTLEGSLSARNLDLKNTVTGLNNVGGFIGSSLESNIVFENITQNGNVSGKKENVGGIAGHLRGGSLVNISASGDVSTISNAKEANLGGIVGLVELTTFNLDTAAFNGTVTSGGDNVGGIIGSLIQGSLNNLQSQGQVNVLDQKYNSVRSHVGGLLGHVSESSVLTNSFSSMSVNAKAQYVGGLAGRFAGKDSILTGSFFTGEVYSYTAFAGGIAGFFFGEVLQDSYSTANINIVNPTPNAYVGGLLGYANNWTSDYQRVYSTGNITISGGLADYVGGLIGYFRGGSLSECYANGNIVGARSSVGGLVGLHRGSTRYCYSTGDVDASFRHAGGLVGYLLNGSIQDSFSLSNVVAKAQSGGIVGYANSSEGSISNVYFYGQVQRAVESSEDLSLFGPIIGAEGVANTVGFNSLYALEYDQVGHNDHGDQVSISNAGDSATYPGLDFVSEGAWRMPNTGYELPGQLGEYTYPIHDWLGEGQIVQTYSVGGIVEGLNYGQIELTLNAQETIQINPGQTNFMFNTQLSSGDAYHVLVSAPGYELIECTVNGGVGNVGTADVTAVQVLCPELETISITPKNLSLGVGEAFQLNASGALSNGVQIDLTREVMWNSDNSSTTILPTGKLSAQNPGSSIIEARLDEFSDSITVNVFAPVAQATNLTWVQISPHNALEVIATWTPSISSNVSGQAVRYYVNGDCSGEPVKSKTLSTSISSDTFIGANLKTYSFNVVSESSDGVLSVSTCSAGMLIQLDPPPGVSEVASSQTWVSGDLPISSPLISWVNPSLSGNYLIKVGLGSTPGSDDIVGHTAIGENNSYVFQNLLGIEECQAFFPTVIVVDENGLESNPATDTIGFRWDNTNPNSINTLSVAGEATETSSPEILWQAPADNCALRFYEMAIGTAPGLDDVSIGFKAVGNTLSYTAISGLNGFNLSLSSGVDYYTSVRAVDYAGNRSEVTVSNPWQVAELQSSLPELIAHLDSSVTSTVLDTFGNDPDSAAFDNSVQEWNDISTLGDTHTFFAQQASERPYYTDGSVFFNGSSHGLVAQSHPDLDQSIIDQKSISISFRTENNVYETQTLFELGGRRRGLNIYISEGVLRCGVWNIRNDGDGAQPFVGISSAIEKNKAYAVTINYHFSNSDGYGGFDCHLNGVKVGSAISSSRIHPDEAGVGIGMKVNGTHFHTGKSRGNGSYFRGEIHEFMMTNQSLNDPEIEYVHAYMMGKWGQDDLSRPNNLAIFNNSLVDRAATASWQPIDPNLFTTSYYEVAIGQTPGGTENLYWKNIGQVLSYQVIDGIDGVALKLEKGIEYYLSIRAVDELGNVSHKAISDPWRIFDFMRDIPNLVLNLSSNDLMSVYDRDGNTPTQGDFLEEVQMWGDTSGFDNHFYSDSKRRPGFDLSNSKVIFNGRNHLIANDSPELNTMPTVEKSVTVNFEVFDDVNSKQVLFEQGDVDRGLIIYLHEGKAHCGFWNITDGGDGQQPYVGLSANVVAFSVNVVTLAFSYQGPESDSILECSINGQRMGTANISSRLFPHDGAGSIGGIDNGTHFQNGPNGRGAGKKFEGKISDVIINNSFTGHATVQGLHNYLLK